MITFFKTDTNIDFPKSLIVSSLKRIEIIKNILEDPIELNNAKINPLVSEDLRIFATKIENMDLREKYSLRKIMEILIENPSEVFNVLNSNIEFSAKWLNRILKDFVIISNVSKTLVKINY